MQWRNSENNYGAVAKFLHWSIVILIIAQYFIAEAAEEMKASLQAEREAIRDAVKQLDDEARELQSGVGDATRLDATPPAGANDSAADPKPPAP